MHKLQLISSAMPRLLTSGPVVCDGWGGVTEVTIRELRPDPEQVILPRGQVTDLVLRHRDSPRQGAPVTARRLLKGITIISFN